MVNGKYTCRFDIQIENDNQFQVARKIIGSNVSLTSLDQSYLNFYCLGMQYEKNS